MSRRSGVPLRAARKEGRSDARLDPLKHWQRAEVGYENSSVRDDIKRALDGIGVVGPERALWDAALRGDAPVAIGLALLILAGGAERRELMFDLAATAVLRCAYDGSAAARLVLPHLRRRHKSARRRIKPR